MKFTVVLLGIVLLICGLLAYSIIPNIHTIPVQSSLALARPLPIVVRPNFQAETQQNITVFPVRNNDIIINVTVSSDSESPSSINFKLYTGPQQSNCTNATNPSGCLVNKNVSNETIRVPVTATTPRMRTAVTAVAKDGSTVIRYVAVMTVSVTTETHRGLAVFPSSHDANESDSPI